MNIKITNVRNENIARIVWDFSRPRGGKDTPIEDVLRIDAPVNDFPDVTMEIKSTIIEREVIASLRDHVMWAQGSRTEDAIKFTYAKNLEGFSDVFENMRKNMIMRKEAGDRQDNFRLCMPVLADTKYMVRLSIRTIAKLAKHFSMLGERHSRPYDYIFTYAASNFIDILQDVLGSKLASSTYDYAKVDITPQITVPCESGTIGDFIVVSTTAPFTLRTHLIRHRMVHVVDTLDAFIGSLGAKATIGHAIHFQACATRDTWRNIIKKRSCWMAHYDVWYDIIYIIQNELGESLLPCEHGVCVDNADAELRYTDADPNPPCPIHAIMNNKNIDAEQYAEMLKLINTDQRGQFWSRKLGEAIS